MKPFLKNTMNVHPLTTVASSTFLFLLHVFHFSTFEVVIIIIIVFVFIKDSN
jgi:hypothetical protein